MYPILLGPDAIGLRLARAVYKPGTSHPWLREGTVLTPQYVQALLQRNVSTVYAENPFVPIQVEEPIPDATRRSAVVALERAVHRIHPDGRQVREITGFVDQIIRELPNHSDTLWNLASLRSWDDYTFEHSVNVGVIAMMIGRRLHYTEGDLRGLGLGAMLHDLGKVFIPRTILNKLGRLEPHEWEIMKTHAAKGYDVLQSQWELSYLTAHCALQHHERLDGSGYPRGLNGAAILEWAAIVAVADVFDALTSERVYKAAQPPHEALAYLREYPQQYDARVVGILTSMAAPYQTGVWVRLSDGRLAVVSEQNPSAPDMPEVAVVADAWHVRIPVERIALSGSSLRIAEVLPAEPLIRWKE